MRGQILITILLNAAYRTPSPTASCFLRGGDIFVFADRAVPPLADVGVLAMQLR
jgi:hypothetical protein